MCRFCIRIANVGAGVHKNLRQRFGGRVLAGVGL